VVLLKGECLGSAYAEERHGKGDDRDIKPHCWSVEEETVVDVRLLCPPEFYSRWAKPRFAATRTVKRDPNV
jgi:hypothetical protein